MSKRRNTYVADDQHLIDGMEKHLSKDSLRLAGSTYTSQDVTRVLQARMDATKAVLVAKAALKDRANEEAVQRAETKDLVDALRQTLLAMFSTSAATLADFGLSPRKRRTPASTESMLARIEKAKSTRAARHTLGPKQKRKISAAAPAPVVSNGTTPHPNPV
jgi:hypothetical protein